ncbi:unnamed protein product [Bursaphelenchus xylophilus]|uniref:(pine wood nematode) hypothetical protein n=1 Tax=Bursaphelenchus xylophilus TaxID=6326 RepID=A0A1I7RMQ7_BURXY|nr:unnamed protein product [Bursaphelenchus xylophilus]CAG9125575.1 unnamed protein product [Bursaphelenchus xylophilus]
MAPTHVIYEFDLNTVEKLFLGKPWWCPLSERRLIDKLSQFQPFGVKKHLELLNLVHAMHYVAEDEENVNFEELISKEDYQLYLKRQKEGARDDVVVFNPKYKFRPNGEEILEKVNEFFDLDAMDKEDRQVRQFPEESYELPPHIESLYEQYTEGSEPPQ